MASVFCNPLGMASATTATTTIWNGWVGTATTATSATSNNAVWVQWIDQYGNAQMAQVPLAQQGQVYVQPPPSPEEIAAAQARQQEANKKRADAVKRGMELLREHLTEKQKETLDKNGWFLVEGGKSKKTYRIRNTGRAGNIDEMKDDKPVATYCVHTQDYEVPDGDQWLAQKLSLEHDEDHIISRANRRLTNQAA